MVGDVNRLGVDINRLYQKNNPKEPSLEALPKTGEVQSSSEQGQNTVSLWDTPGSTGLMAERVRQNPQLALNSNAPILETKENRARERSPEEPTSVQPEVDRSEDNEPSIFRVVPPPAANSPEEPEQNIVPRGTSTPENISPAAPEDTSTEETNSIEGVERVQERDATVSNEEYDIVVVGDELESVIAAISAAQTSPDQRIALIRRENENQLLGGLITRSNQTFLDRDFTNYQNKQELVGEYERILERAGVRPNDISVNPERFSTILRQELEENGVTLINGADNITVNMEEGSIGNEITSLDMVTPNGAKNIAADVFIDTTPDGILFDQTNAPSLGNFRDFMPEEFEEGNSGLLSYSPIPEIHGITFSDLDDIDHRVRTRGVDFSNIEGLEESEMGLPADPQAERLNSQGSKVIGPALGLDFIRYMYEKYPEEAQRLELSDREGARTSIRGFNLSVPEAGAINFNGLLFRPDSAEQAQQYIDEGTGATPDMEFVTDKFVEYLQQQTGRRIWHEMPDDLYVRDAGEQFATTNPRTLEDLVTSEVNANTVATFSYPNDIRGQELEALTEVLRDDEGRLIKPEVQIQADEGQSINVENLLGVSQSIGSTPGTKGVSRIQQLMSITAEMLGIRAAMAASSTNGDTDSIDDRIITREMHNRGYAPRPSAPVPLTPEERAFVNREEEYVEQRLNLDI